MLFPRTRLTRSRFSAHLSSRLTAFLEGGQSYSDLLQRMIDHSRTIYVLNFQLSLTELELFLKCLIFFIIQSVCNESKRDVFENIRNKYLKIKILHNTQWWQGIGKQAYLCSVGGGLN